MKITKRCLCLVLAAILLLPAGLSYAQNTPSPVLQYSFEDSENAPTLFGNAALVYDEDKQGKVLSLDGSSGTYAAMPQGFFDNRNVMTITFDLLAGSNSGNYFTFAFGQNNEVYNFFRVRDNEIRNAITRWSYPNEHEVRCEQALSSWAHIALVWSNTEMQLYVNGTLAATNSNTEILVSDLGTNLLAYFGKSFYDGDGYFNGCFDNFAVYDSVLSADAIAAQAQAQIPDAPVLRYTFEENTALPTLFGNAETVYDSEHKSRVLSLDGSSNTYAALPQGLLDNRNRMTILFDVKSNGSGGNFFTFAFGQDSTRYDFFRLRGSEVRNAITVNTYYNEHEVKTAVDYGNAWMSVALVFDGTVCRLYVNGTQCAANENTEVTVSDLGSNLLAYLGKSFYDGDGYFNGCFDNFEIYDGVLSDSVMKAKAMAHLPLLISASVGEVVSNLDNVSGTDSHTAVSTAIDRDSGVISSIIQRRQNAKAVPVSFYSLNEDCTVTVDGTPFGNSGYLDLTYNRTLTITCDDMSETYTLQAAQTARNPVLPGMYADPDIDVLGDRFWIFPTTDGTPGWGGTQFHAFSSRDMVHWTDEGVILDNKNKTPGVNDKGVQIASSAWSDGNAWAPAIEEKNGKYYFYYCGRILDSLTSLYGEGMAIGVAWADSPAGPYTAADAPIVYPKMLSDANIGFYGQAIDPAVYTEDDTSYLLFGNGMAAMATLSSDMKTVDTSSFYLFSDLTDFRESIAVFKREGAYYFTWSCDDTGSENYHINYGTASALKGKITNQGTLLQKDTSTGILATGHQSVLYLPDSDRCFIAYHRFYTPLSIGGNVGHRRETCIEEITFKNRLIQVDLLNTVTPSMTGVSPMDIYGNNLTETMTYPTCTENGSIITDSFTLTAEEAPEIKATGHQYRKETHAATCAADGYDEYRCTLCGSIYRDNLQPKTGHDLRVTRQGSVFVMTCTRGDWQKTATFTDHLHLTAADSAFDAVLDRNADGIINGRDYVLWKQLINETE